MRKDCELNHLKREVLELKAIRERSKKVAETARKKKAALYVWRK